MTAHPRPPSACRGRCGPRHVLCHLLPAPDAGVVAVRNNVRCESAQGSGSFSKRQHCIERNYKKLVDRGSPSAPIGTPAAAHSVIRHKDLQTLLQEVYFDADSQLAREGAARRPNVSENGM